MNASGLESFAMYFLASAVLSLQLLTTCKGEIKLILTDSDCGV
jgi:hypothetical protein